MNYKRANEIINSPNKVEIFYNGDFSWLLEINEQNKTAKVQIENTKKDYTLNNQIYSDQPLIIEVPLSELIEGRIIG